MVPPLKRLTPRWEPSWEPFAVDTCGRVWTQGGIEALSFRPVWTAVDAHGHRLEIYGSGGWGFEFLRACCRNPCESDDTDVYQRHCASESWAWPSDGQDNRFTWDLVNKGAGDDAVLSLSAAVRRGSPRPRRRSLAHRAGMRSSTQPRPPSGSVPNSPT